MAPALPVPLSLRSAASPKRGDDIASRLLSAFPFLGKEVDM
jgi:hypothetical protein